MKTIDKLVSGVTNPDEVLQGLLFAAGAFLMTAGTLMTCLLGSLP
jgi:hypothetical protein